MFSHPKLTKTRIILALSIAITADILQFPITAAETTGLLSVPAEAADIFIDCVVAAATSLLLGFHWVLLPTVLLEAVPGLDLLPTWTACVALVISRRKKEQLPSDRPVIDV